ncbi:hypothetical protein DMC25_15780 [Caulobacter sp. D4A]|uniref:amphi-Trp domain-containing protein n=1 Tax=Caulobacter sp. D4A TaxID=2204171 RepID=UPI000D73F7F6|nr:amphi-Trp domain-containing protein [Caulobacter sp. D4A]PXA85202.1 hypothetical protein DMC25_15780 [Caulobacter sp. D4A]
MESARELEKGYSLTQFVAELRRLADTLEANGHFTINIDEEEIVVPEDAIASIAFEIEEGRAELEFQLSWETSVLKKRTSRTRATPKAKRPNKVGLPRANVWIDSSSAPCGGTVGRGPHHFRA